MLEIILLIFLCKKIGAIIRDKGRSPLAFQVLTVFLWSVAKSQVLWSASLCRAMTSRDRLRISLLLSARRLEPRLRS